MAHLTYRKTVSAVVSGNLVAQYTYAGLGTSLEGLSAVTHKVAPLVFVDNDTNRRLRPDNIDENGFDVYGDNAGDDPPYNLQIWIIPNSVSGDDDFGAMKRNIRNHLFTFPNGRRWNLWGEEGMELIPEPALTTIFNRSMRDVNTDVLDDAEVCSGTLTVDQDYITLPSDLLMIKDIIVFDNSSYAKGYSLEPSSTYEGLMENGTNLEGFPQRYYSYRKTVNATRERIIQFDRKPDAAYNYELHYWKMMDTVSADNDVPELFSGYHELIETRALHKVATRLGDQGRKVEFMADYQEQIKRAQRTQRRFNVAQERVRYGII